MKLKGLFALLLLSICWFGASACEQEGPLEKAGESVDEAVEDAGDSIEDATD